MYMNQNNKKNLLIMNQIDYLEKMMESSKNLSEDKAKKQEFSQMLLKIKNKDYNSKELLNISLLMLIQINYSIQILKIFFKNSKTTLFS